MVNYKGVIKAYSLYNRNKINYPNIIVQLYTIRTKINLIKLIKLIIKSRNLPFANEIHSSFANNNVYQWSAY